MPRKDRLARGVGGVRDHGEDAARHGAVQDRVARGVAEAGYERREVGDEGVVVEGSEERGAEVERYRSEPREHGRDPPSLQPAVDDEPGEEEPDEERRPEVDRALVDRRG